MKFKKTGLVASLLALALLLAACGSSIQKKKEEFGRTVDALLAQGFVLEKKSDGEEKSTYLLRLDKSQKVTDFLIRSALGSSDARLRKDLSALLKGMRLELDVDWQRYADARPGSVAAYLLPREGNATGELNRLLKERKIAADLDFDESGDLKKVTMRPLNEAISKNDKSGRIEVRDTVLVIKRSGKETYDQAYSFRSGLWKLAMKSPKGEHLDMGYTGLECDADMNNAYYGVRKCRVSELSLDMEMGEGKARTRTRFLIRELGGDSRVSEKNGAVSSDGRIAFGAIVVREDSPRETFDVTLNGIEISGRGDGIAADTYRRLMDLLAEPPADEKEGVKKVMGILGEFFKKMTLGYRITVKDIQGWSESPLDGEKTEVEMQGLSFGVDWAMAEEFNLSKMFRMEALQVRQSHKGTPRFEGKIKGLAFGLKAERLYNFLPELMVLAKGKAGNPGAKIDPQTRKAMEALGARIVQRGVTLTLDPFRFDSLEEKEGGMSQSFDAMELRLRVELAPNKLDPNNPMAPMLALAYLKADGKATLKKKDLQQILPLLDPPMQMMVTQYVAYEGENAVFDLKFEQGNLLINGKPLQ